MKRNLFLLTGLGFVGLNLIEFFKHKNYKIKIFGKKKKYPFKIKFKSKNVTPVYKNVLNVDNIKKYDFKNSIIIITTLNSTKEKFLKEFDRLLEFIKKKNIKKIILLSTVGVYGNNRSGKIRILDKYSNISYKAEKIFRLKFKHATILRVGNLFGPLRPKPGTIEKICMQCLNISKFKFFKYQTTRSYLSIDEFNIIIEKIIKKKRCSNIYNITSNNYIMNLKKIINFFENFYKKKIVLQRNNIQPKIKISHINNSQEIQKMNYKKSKNFNIELSKIEKFLKNYIIKKKTYNI